MPKLKVYLPETLEDLCLSAVLRCLETDLMLCEVARGMASSSLLLRQIDLSLTRIADGLTNYLAFLPGTLSEMVRQQITTRVLKKYTNSTNSQPRDLSMYKTLPLHTMTVRLLEIVLNEDVHSFDLSELQPNRRLEPQQPHAGEPFLWDLLLNRCSGLQKFALPPSLSKCYETDLNAFVILLAQQCTKLTEVILKDAVQDGKALAALGAHCPSLKVIDISGSPIICNDILYLIFPDMIKAENPPYNRLKLAKVPVAPMEPEGYLKSELCSTLRELNVSDTKVKSFGTYFALKYFPRLESLGECFYVASGLRKHRSEGNDTTFKLKHLCCRLSTGEKMKMVCAACPNLETLYVVSWSEIQFTLKLSNMRKLIHLRSLTLEGAYSLDLTGLRFIQQLNYLKVQLPDVDVGHIAEACPLLERLVINAVAKKTFTLSEEHDKLPLFQSLQELQIDHPVAVNVASFIIRKATQLRTVKMVRVKKLTDQILSRWLQINPLVNLQTWLLTYAHLTMISVTHLLTKCPCLSTLGRLSGWDVRSWESRRLERSWRLYDLNLVLFSHKNDVAQIMDATASSDEEQE